ncbi:MAG: S8 family serine peptidase [Chloroflexota bacterium]
MGPVRRVPRSVTAAVAMLLVVAASTIPTVSTHAAGPTRPPDGAIRAARNAWDRPTGDDPDRLIVTFRGGTSTLSRHASLRAAGAVSTSGPSVAIDRTTVVDTEPGSRDATIAALRADPHVERVSVDHRRYRDTDPTAEQYWVEQWGLENTGQDIYQGTPDTGGVPDVDVDAAEAFALTTGSASTVVAVIDDGVDFSHPDLAARAWTNPGESGGGKETNGIDDDANGYIDDVHGWDFCHDDNTVHDFNDDFHGTHVAGILGASLDGAGVVGVAPGVSIMALKFLGDDLDCGFDSMAIAAIHYAKSFGVRIANASWGGIGAPSDAPELYDAIRDSGMLFVAAAGNDGGDNDDGPWTNLPASFDLPNIISVAAVDNRGGLSSFSNYGPRTVDIAAPGEGILSSLPADPGHPTPGWGWLDGTSMATPHVSGVAALVASVLPALADDPVALRARILGSGKPDSWTAGLTATGRIVDGWRAMDQTPPVAAAPSSFRFVVGSQLSSTSATVRVDWPAGTDDQTGIAGYGVGQRAGLGPWTTPVGSTSSRHADRPVPIGASTSFRIRARDGAGNWSDWSDATTITPARYQESGVKVTYHGTWRTFRTSSASGGRQRYATHKGASVTFRFTGRSVAIVAPRGASRGSAKFYVDGVYVSTVDLHRSSWTPRNVVAARSWKSAGSHTIKLVVLATPGHPRVDVDGFLVIP